MIGQQRPARGRDERRQALEQLQRVQEQRRGPVAPRAAELIEQLAARALRQPLQRERRAQEIAAQALHLVATVGPNGDIGVQAEAFKPGAPRGGRLGAGGRAEAAEGLPGARAEGHAALQRGGDRLGKERLLRRERVAPGVVLRQPAAAGQEPPDAAVQPREERRDVGVGGRGQAVEDGRAVGVARV